MKYINYEYKHTININLLYLRIDLMTVLFDKT
jgi:hypothetical protein